MGAVPSYFGQAGCSYDNRYVLNATLRRDGFSRFGSNNRWGMFPSVSAGWNVTNEAFFQRQKLVSALKLRVSWGRLGNQEIGNYPYSSLVETGNYVYPFGGSIVTGAQLVENGNENVKWETTTQTNFGMDRGLWKDRLSVIADYYIKTSDDILVRVPVPLSGGAQHPPYVNAGSVENKGWELGLVYKQRNENFNWSWAKHLRREKQSALYCRRRTHSGRLRLVGRRLDQNRARLFDRFRSPLENARDLPEPGGN